VFVCICEQKGNQALHIASLAGQLHVVKLLIQHDADINAQSQVCRAVSQVVSWMVSLVVSWSSWLVICLAWEVSQHTRILIHTGHSVASVLLLLDVEGGGR